MEGERTEEQLRHHYEVEKELADRLRNSTREERPALFKTLYEDLFRRVPDHPRLTRRETPEESRRSVENRMRLLLPYLNPGITFLEFAPGDCRLAFEVAKFVKKVIAVDISDQRNPDDDVPENFELVVYNGYDLDLPAESADLLFSYQFLEHLHPEDVEGHFDLALKLLRKGGRYVFDTPHAYSGPHDISAYFSDVPAGFHFKEWTYREMGALLKEHGFSGWSAYRRGKVLESAAVNRLTIGLEGILGLFPPPARRKLSKRLFTSVAMAARK